MLRRTGLVLLVLSLAAPPAAGDVPAPQVSIEARLVEATPRFARDLGVDFKLGGADPGAAPAEGPWIARSEPVDRGWLDRVTELLAGPKGVKAELLAPPKVLATAAAPATLAIGGTTPPPDGAATAASGRAVEVVIQIRITPLIGDDGELRLELRPEVSELAFGPDGPQTVVRRAVETVQLGGGETLVVGGLFSESMRGVPARMPQLADVPQLGQLFRSDLWQRGDTELLILIEPTLVDPESGTWRARRAMPPAAADPRLGPAPGAGAPPEHPPPVHPPAPVHPPKHP